MGDWVDKYFINNIERKLQEQRPLEQHEINMVIAALRKDNDYTQTPYYEIVYHDEYDRQEKRIMNPVAHNCSIASDLEDYLLIRDSFQIDFNRIVPRKKESGEENGKGMSDTITIINSKAIRS